MLQYLDFSNLDTVECLRTTTGWEQMPIYKTKLFFVNIAIKKY